MKTKFLLTIGLAFCLITLGFSQVGVGNTNPQAQLDISASSTVSPTNLDGILIPRMSNLPASGSMTANQDGMLVFYTGAGFSGKGFYYWDNSTVSWIYLSSGPKNTLDEAYDEGGLGAGKNIIATDGSLRINGTDGLVVTGVFNNGNSIDDEVTGNGIRMFFNPRSGSFRTGGVSGNTWEQANLGAYSFSAGNNSNASGIGSASFGLSNGASGNYSFAAGVVNVASGESSAAFGDGTRSLGTNSFTAGFNNDANGGSSTALGSRNNALGAVSFVNGLFNTAYSWGETVLGLYSSGYTPAGGTSSFNSSDRLFTLGNGTATNARSNALIVFKDGRILINDSYFLPNLDGTPNQVLATNGGGQVSFIDATTLVTDEIDWYEEATTSKPNDINDDIYTQGHVAIGKTIADYPLDIENNSSADLRGLNVSKSDNSASETSAIYVSKTGNGTGRSHGFFSDVDGSGSGQKYGIFNRIGSNANGNQYGTRNYLSGATPSFQFGTFNNLDNNGTGNQYGVYNGMRGNSANNLFGLYNEFDRATSANETTAVRNAFNNGTPGAGGINGVYNTFTNAANGNYYGNRTEFTNAATGNGNKYGTYNVISSGAGGMHFGTYNNVNVNDGWAGYFLGRNYISSRLSIGEIDNATARLNIRQDSNATNSHIELEEAGGNDGARIRFTNAAETTNTWLIYGRADNTVTDSRLNIFHSGSGNVMEIYGDNTVELNGQFGINLNNPTYAIHLPNSGVIGTGQGRANAWTTYSDSRVKSNQQPLSNGLELISKMTPKTYFHHDGNIKDGILELSESGELTVGFIAQELYGVFPEAVQKPEDENEALWSVDYDKIIPVAVSAIQELKEEVEALKEENALLKSKLKKNSELEARLLSIEKRLNNVTNYPVSASANK